MRFSCIKRECQSYGTNELTKWYKPLINVAGEKKVVWQHWTSKEIDSTETKGKVTQKELESNETSVNDLIKELRNDSENLSYHIHVANNQRKVSKRCQRRCQKAPL